jgi:hypothetical protein
MTLRRRLPQRRGAIAVGLEHAGHHFLEISGPTRRCNAEPALTTARPKEGLTMATQAYIAELVAGVANCLVCGIIFALAAIVLIGV